MSLPLTLFAVQGQSPLPRRRLDELRRTEISALIGLLPTAKQRERFRIALRRATDATIESVQVKRRYAEIVVGFTRYVKMIGRQVVEVPTQYRIWLRRSASLLAVVGTSSTLAEAFATSVQWSMAGETSTLSKFPINAQFLHRLERWLQSKDNSRPGAVIRARFVDATLESDVPFDEIILASQTLLSSRVYRSLSKGAGEPVNVSFLSPLCEGLSRQLSCSLSFRGMLRILTAETSAEEANYLLDEFETLSE